MSVALQQGVQAGPAGRGQPDASGLRRFWIGLCMMWCLEHCPRLMRGGRGFFTSGAWHAAPSLRAALLANARRLLGPDASPDELAALGHRVLVNFYEFICELADGGRRDDLLARIGQVDGLERYEQARALKRGAVLVTAHLGSFETAVAALRQVEPRVHIVFRRDPMVRFERLRAAQRKRLGVIEAPVDDGLAMWVRLRDALRNDEVVLMQGDRVMPGQPGVRVPFLGGHMLVPSGPVKLALTSGAPLAPIFAPRQDDGRVRIALEEPIFVGDEAPAVDAHQALARLTAAIERFVRDYPGQWLVLHRALCEDQLEAA